MLTRSTLIAAVICTFTCISGRPDAAAPVPADKEKAEQEKVVQAFVGKVITAYAKHDLDTLVNLSDVPWCRDPSNFTKDEQDLRGDLRRVLLDGKPKFEPKYTIKRIVRFKTIQAKLTEGEAKGFRQVLTDDDFIVFFEVERPDRKIQGSWLVKMKDGKPKLVGVGPDEDE